MIKDLEDAVFSLNALYDEFMGFLPQYTPEVFQYEPYATVRSWDQENPLAVSREMQDMRFFKEKVCKAIPSMTYTEFKDLTTYERDWLKTLISTPTQEELAEQAQLAKLTNQLGKK